MKAGLKSEKVVFLGQSGKKKDHEPSQSRQSELRRRHLREPEQPDQNGAINKKIQNDVKRHVPAVQVVEKPDKKLRGRDQMFIMPRNQPVPAQARRKRPGSEHLPFIPPWHIDRVVTDQRDIHEEEKTKQEKRDLLHVRSYHRDRLPGSA